LRNETKGNASRWRSDATPMGGLTMPRYRFTRPGLVVSRVLLACIATGFGVSAAAHTDVHVGVHVDVAALFKMIDTSHDGQISHTEYTDHANKVFNQCDADHDGKLSEQELQACTKTLDQNGIPVSGSSSQTTKAMDANQNGSVSRQGYDAYASQQFRKMDTNHSGSLSSTELGNGVQGAAPPASSGQPAQH
jgi:Ca2+-binding EF-hand superfamily protein